MGALNTTTDGSTASSERERLATLGLWSVPGLGPKAFARLRAWAGGSVAPLLDLDISEFANGAQVELNVTVRQRLMALQSLEAAAEEVIRAAEASVQRICFRGDAGYPRRLAEVEDAPPVLFMWGELGPERRRVAMVGSRNPTNQFLQTAHRIAREVAQRGVGVVSGAAYGVDQACHQGAISAGGETWAFVGSSLDQLDAVPWKQVTPILKARGVIMSEYPPGVRADKSTFPRRNRLISGASDVVAVLRAAQGSGALITAHAALQQGRPVFTIPGDPDEETAQGCNWLLSTEMARAFTCAEDLLASLGLPATAKAAPARPAAELLSRLSADARALYEVMERVPTELEELAASVDLTSSALTSALVELELNGLCLQYAGKVYEKI